MRMSERGSVLMELIVVFPIYLVLFGGIFMIGDMLVKASRLPSADRTAAFDVQNAVANGWASVLNGLFHPALDVSDRRMQPDLLSRERVSEFYADTRVSGPFSLRAAVKVRNDYALLVTGARGQLSYADWFFNRSVGASRMTDVPHNDMGQLLLGNRVAMYSKDNGVARNYTYNYYTLKRVKYSASEHTWRSNRRPVSDIVNADATRAHWCVDVNGEAYHGDVNDASNQKNDPEAIGTFVDYSRYGQFVTWSQ